MRTGHRLYIIIYFLTLFSARYFFALENSSSQEQQRRYVCWMSRTIISSSFFLSRRDFPSSSVQRGILKNLYAISLFVILLLAFRLSVKCIVIRRLRCPIFPCIQQKRYPSSFLLVYGGTAVMTSF